ncbi:Protein component of the small (40S) ribosomal subunit [Binucleata daphniae]
MTTKRISKELLCKIPIFHVDTTVLNCAIADHLKQTDYLTIPENGDIIKTGVAKKMPPQDKDWFYKRAASVFRAVVLDTMKTSDTDKTKNDCKGIGTGYFARKYSARQNRGVRPSRYAKGSTGHVKGILEDFTKCGWFKRCEIGYCASENGLSIMKEFIDKIQE